MPEGRQQNPGRDDNPHNSSGVQAERQHDENPNHSYEFPFAVLLSAIISFLIMAIHNYNTIIKENMKLRAENKELKEEKVALRNRVVPLRNRRLRH